MYKYKNLDLFQSIKKKQILTPIFLDSVSAGFPSPATDYMENKLDLNEYLIKHPAATFIVKAKGPSMSDAGILSGDLLIVDRSIDPKSNDIVIASRFVDKSKINGLTFWRHLLSIGAKYLFKLFYSYKNLNDYTCNFRAYKFKLIKELLKNKKFFKNEDFNIAAKIILFLTNKYKNLNLLEVPFTLSYDYKIGQSKMKLAKTIGLTFRLIFFRKYK